MEWAKGVLSHNRNVIRRNMRMRKSDDLVVSNPLRIHASQITRTMQRLRTSEDIVDHSFEIVPKITIELNN
jgi:hypothetical protein